MAGSGFYTQAARPPARRWVVPGPVTVFTWLSVVTLFAISHLALTGLGLAYEASGGSPIEKIAPGTYLCVIAFIALMVERDPIALLDELVRRHKGLIVFCVCWVMLFTYIYMYQGPPLTATFDTFLLPILLFVILPRLPQITQRHIAVFLHGFMMFNALFGLAEFVGGFRLTPVVAQGLVLDDEWRSTALLGHPLMNASMTASYAVILLLGGGRDMPAWLRPLALLIQCAGLAVFGGRLATVLFAGVLGLFFIRAVLDVARGRRFSLTAAAIAAIVLPLMVTAVAALAADGFFDKFLNRFVDDAGSADTRVRMFDLLDQIPFHAMLVGADPDVVATLQRTNGIAFGIESFWIGFIAYYGLLISIPFFIGLIAFCISLSRATLPGSGWAVAFFILLCSGSASLSGKGTLLGTFVILVMILMRPGQGVRMAR